MSAPQLKTTFRESLDQVNLDDNDVFRTAVACALEEGLEAQILADDLGLPCPVIKMWANGQAAPHRALRPLVRQVLERHFP